MGGVKGCTNWSDLAGDEGGRRGGGGPGRRARGGGRWGGAPESSVGATSVHWFHLLGSLENLTIGLLAGDEGRQAWGGWAREAGKGGKMGGAPESTVGATRKAPETDLAGDEGGRRGGGGPGRRARGGRWGGAPESSVGLFGQKTELSV